MAKNVIKRIVLASASPRRHAIISGLGLQIPIEICESGADEQVPADWTPAQIVEQLAMRKAVAVYAQVEQSVAGASEPEGAVIIGADTIVVLDGEVLGKPLDGREAASMLRRLSGRTHLVYSGIACLPATGDGSGRPRARTGHTVSEVTFRAMDEAEIQAYVRTGEPLDKAGSYGVQGQGAIFVDRIAGDFYSIMGLSANLLYTMLQPFGVSFFAQPADSPVSQ